MFTDSNKDAIAAYLGYAVTEDNQALIASACVNVESLSSTAVARVQGYLTTLGTIDSELATARVTVGSAVGQLQGQGRRFISQLAIALDLDTRSDYYSG